MLRFPRDAEANGQRSRYLGLKALLFPLNFKQAGLQQKNGHPAVNRMPAPRKRSFRWWFIGPRLTCLQTGSLF